MAQELTTTLEAPSTAPRPISKARALREVEASAAERAQLMAQLTRLEATRDRRIVRACGLGLDKATVARVANLSRQRVGQIVGEA